MGIATLTIALAAVSSISSAPLPANVRVRSASVVTDACVKLRTNVEPLQIQTEHVVHPADELESRSPEPEAWRGFGSFFMSKKAPGEQILSCLNMAAT